MKHTQGKWEVKGFENGYKIMTNEEYIAYLSHYREAEANARLIASAPELFNILNSINDALEEGYEANIEPESLLHDQIRQAIEKAES